MHDPSALARDILDAYASRTPLPPPSSLDGGLDLDTAYAVEAAIVDARRAAGHTPVGLKAGYANRAVWRALKLDTLVWAHMYDDTVVHASSGPASDASADVATVDGDAVPAIPPAASAPIDISRMVAPKIEPEIVFKLKQPIPDGADAAAALACVEWLALGFEIIDCVFPDWKLTPADFVAAKGLHARLIVGPTLGVTPETMPALVDRLATFTVALERDGENVAQGSGRNCLKSPALCLGELATAVRRRAGDAELGRGALISSGTLTESQPLAPGQRWSATVSGLDLPPLVAHTVA